MQKLKDALMSFQGLDSEANAVETFKELAKPFLYGGYFLVGDEYEIYLKTVEFYYHEENGAIKDPIVYHRNGRFGERIVPYFKPITIHSHWSGFDVAFENPDKEYRASALLREYYVYDRTLRKFVYWDTKGAKDDYSGTYRDSDNPILDNRSTYLQFYFNGFTLKGDACRIEWVDFKNPFNYEPKEKCRKGILNKYSGYDRKWGFTRIDKIEKPEDLRHE